MRLASRLTEVLDRARTMTRARAPDDARERSGPRAFVAELAVPDFLGLSPVERDQAMDRLGQTLVTLRRFRLLSYRAPVAEGQIRSSRLGTKPQLPTALGHRLIDEELYVIQRILRAADTRATRHLLITWDQAVHGLPGWVRPVGERAALDVLQPLQSVDYGETPDYLYPSQAPLAGGPPQYVKIIGTHEFRPGQQTWQDPWAALMLEGQGSQIVCFDARHVDEEALRRLKQGLKNLSAASSGRDDDMVEAVRTAQEALRSRQPIFAARVLVLLRDSDRMRLLERAGALVQSFGNALGFSLLAGEQAAALRFFGDTPDPVMPSPDAHHIVLGDVLPVAAAGLAGIVSRVRPAGYLLGVRVETGAPLYVEEWRAGEEQADHYLILGKTGSGKSVFQARLLYELHALYGAVIVHIEPLGVCERLRRLCEASGVEDLHYHNLDWSNTSVNPLDWSADDLRAQLQHVIALIEIMLGRPLGNVETGLLSDAVQALYRGRDRRQMARDPEAVPRLEGLCAELRALRHPRAGEIADELEFNFVRGPYCGIFNAPTTLGSANGFRSGVHLYNVFPIAGPGASHDRMAKRLQTILYYALVRRVYRAASEDKLLEQARPGYRGPRRVFSLDELYVLLQNPFLASVVTEGIKTARNLRLKFVLAEQDVAALVGGDVALVSEGSGLKISAGRAVINHTERRILFRQEPGEIQLAAQTFQGGIPGEFVEWLPTVDPGYGIALLGKGQNYRFYNQLLPTEGRYLLPGELQELREAQT